MDVGCENITEGFGTNNSPGTMRLNIRIVLKDTFSISYSFLKHLDKYFLIYYNYNRNHYHLPFKA